MFERVNELWKKPVFKGIVVVAAVAVIAIIIRGGDDTVEETAETKRLVTVTSAQEIAGEQNITLIGTVRAFTEADVTSERSGRITSVTTELGAEVSAGQILATLENAAEQASVLQAQGAYEAALASASQSTFSASEAATAVVAAENALASSLRSAYATANQIVLNDIDDLFSSPQSSLPGLKLEGFSQTAALSAERVAFQNILIEWSNRTSNISSGAATEDISYSLQQLNRTISFVDTFLSLFPQQDIGGRYTQAELESFISTFTNNRSALLNAVSSIEAAQTSLSRAEDTADRVTAASSGGAASSADAQVKQALGSLRAAQANLAKTVFRSPISGTVNALPVSVGDFVGSFDRVALVANNSALEIVAFIGDFERDQLSVGEEVVVEGKYQGIITNIAPAVDEQTRKTEIRIATDSDEIANGDTVRVTKSVASTTTNSEDVYVPLSAVKFELEDGFIMKVEQGKLVQVPVTLGSVRGSTIEVVEGLSVSDQFVEDVRGLTAGTEVEVNL